MVFRIWKKTQRLQNFFVDQQDHDSTCSMFLKRLRSDCEKCSVASTIYGTPNTPHLIDFFLLSIIEIIQEQQL